MKEILKHFSLKTIFYMILSNVMYSLSFTLFYLNNEITAGGFSGIAAALSHVLPITPGMLYLIMTLPFLIWGGFQQGWIFSIETFLSNLMFSLIEDALLWTPTLTHNQLLAAVFGGVLYSLGTIFMLKAGISAGGTDLLGQLIRHHFPHITHGNVILFFNVLGVLIRRTSNRPSLRLTSLVTRPLKPPTLMVLVIMPKTNSSSRT